MTEHAGVVRDEHGLLTGLAELAAIEARIADIGVHPDIAGFHDLAHAFDLKGPRPCGSRHARSGPRAP